MSDADRRAVEKLEDTRLGLKEDDDDNDLLGGRPSDFKALLKTKEKQVSVPSCRRTTRAAARTPRLPPTAPTTHTRKKEAFARAVLRVFGKGV